MKIAAIECPHADAGHRDFDFLKIAKTTATERRGAGRPARARRTADTIETGADIVPKYAIHRLWMRNPARSVPLRMGSGGWDGADCR